MEKSAKFWENINGHMHFKENACAKCEKSRQKVQ